MDWIMKFCAQVSLLTVQVTWTEDAKCSFRKLKNNIKKRNGAKAANQFQELVLSKIQLIASHPKMYMASESLENVRRCVVIRTISLYYLEIEVEEKVKLILFQDNRMEDDGLDEIE